ncbi:M15 family metallopeptidase [Janthinobacterium sp. 17J80-10]|uniref:M15 family metallopeptidase n=1 Tax=Janthinobacterium sp. 17J80-10 TaxID=2497863 RepID=UPI00100552F1|nr:M15 family metallopeptidase [Janthinobacterium sp. 17J80-10]QAU34565.1 M15 family peptidase [Janthinobacterium sp. 17J80-10]
MQESNGLLFTLVTAYALIIAIGGWLVLDSRRRQSFQQQLERFGVNLAQTFAGAGNSFGQGAQRTRGRFYKAFGTVSRTLESHKWQLLLAVLILVVPVAASLLLQPSRALRAYDDFPQNGDPVILALLRGEQLSPPPPLPPEAFVTREVEAVRQNLAGASREWMLLDADFRQRLLTVFHLMAQKGYAMALLEGYRSPERQSYLASLGSSVTNAGAYQSFHQYGLAADSAFIRGGKLVISEKDPWAMEGYRLYGEYAESVGLVWGGRWKMMDFGHVELRKAGTINRKHGN